MHKILGGMVILGLLSLWPGAYAFNCPADFAQAEAEISKATSAMDAMSNGENKGLVHTLIDDAKMLLHSAKHNHEKPAAGGYDHARAIGYAQAAEILAAK